MTLHRTLAVTAIAAIGLPAVTGCLKRTETITVAPDGGASIRVSYEWEDREIPTIDALPSAESGWEVSQTTENEDDKTKHVLTATRSFASGEQLPRTFATPGEPNADLYIDFPTEVRIEQREDGRYYHFRREYSPRKWAYVHYWQDRIYDDDIKKYSEMPKEKLTHEERIRLFKALTAIEAHKQIELAKAALKESGVPLAPDAWLQARRALLDVYEEVDYDYFLDLEDQTLDESQAPEAKQAAEERINREADEILQQAQDKLLETLQLHLGKADYAAFERELERATLYYKITDETGGHFFEIRVKMPGRIIAHNADKVDDNGEAVWEFSGEAFRDRAHELMITSRLQVSDEDAHD